MNLSVSIWDLTPLGEWERFLSFFLPYLEEVEGEEAFLQEKDEVTSENYRNQIFMLSERDISPYVTAALDLDGKRIGFAQYVVFPLEHLKSVLGNIYLLPEYRNKGYGSFFYEEIEKDLLRRGARYVDCSINPPAFSFYQRKGFQKTNDLMAENNLPAYRKFLKRPFPYHKILVLGSPGAGKSYLSDQLAKRFGYPIIHMDPLYWKPNWEHLTDEEMRLALDKVMEQRSWIIDGNYQSTLEYRYQKAEMVFFLDYPPEICLQGESERRGKPRDDFPSFLKEGEDPNFIHFIATFPQNGRPFLEEMANKYLHTPFTRFTSREECNQFLSLFPQKK
jgi:GNAT superfamily N-acetyltransferase